MKKIGILTLNGNTNYGNKLQNYALKKVVEERGFYAETIWFEDEYNKIKTIIKKLAPIKRNFVRENKFERFTKKYLNRKMFNKINVDSYDNFIVGSDQVWNYNFRVVNKYTDRYFLSFSKNKNKNIAYAASIGVDDISNDFKKKFHNGLNNIEHISVRESQAKVVINKKFNIKNVEVVLDPTMLLEASDWQKIERKPKKINKEKFILNYFLGDIPDELKDRQKKFAEENNYKIINLLDKESEFYICSPQEFLYLERNAVLVCTDSFHSCVFAILFDTPFVIFDRKEKNVKNMNSRIDTLLNTFELNDRKYNDKLTFDDYLVHDYKKAYDILEKHKKKSMEFLEKSLDVKKGE